jgi:hypothetical protein
MVRGDFINGRSDLDMMAIVSGQSERRRLRKFYLSFCESHGCGDEPEFEKTKNIIPFQLFIFTPKELSEMDYGIYYEDFMQNHIVLYGEEITSLIKRPNSKAAAKKFISNALRSSKSWKDPPQKVLQRHLKWTKFYPAYLTIETIKAAMLYHGILDFDKNRLIKNIGNLPNFKEKVVAKRVLEIYSKDEAREMSLEKLKQTYTQLYGLIRYVAQLCKIRKEQQRKREF